MTEPLVRIDRGEPTEEELAALTSVVFALLSQSGRAPCVVPGSGRASWRRLERANGYRSPISWK